MKNGFSTILRHKLQWLLLLAALLGVSHGVWGATRNVACYSGVQPNLWTWKNGDTSTHYWGTTWSGNKMTSKENDWYYASFDTGSSSYYIIFSNSGNNQTNDIGALSGNAVYWYDSTKSDKSSNSGTYAAANTFGIKGSWDSWTTHTMGSFDFTYFGYTYTYNSMSAGTYTFGWYDKSSDSNWRNYYDSSRSTGVTLSTSGNDIQMVLSAASNVTFYIDPGNFKVFVRATSTCTTPSISAVTPSSAQTKSLPTSSATPSVTQAVTATYSGGNQIGWTVTPSTISGYTAATFDNAANASTNLNMNYEGEYTATFGAGCGNTTDATLTTAKITVNPSEIYIAGPLLNGGNDWATNTLMTKGSTSFYYDWDAARTTGEFTLRTSNSASEAAYIIPNYAKNNYTGISPAKDGNHNLSVDGVSFAVGDKVRVTAKYKGWNSSEGKPEYDITFTKRCSYPTAGSLTAPKNVCSGENFTITLSGHTATSTTISWRKRVYNGSAYGSWTVIEGETGTSLTISQTAQTQYKAKVTTTSGSCYKEATAVTVKMYTNSSVSSVDLSSNSVCIGQSGITASATKTLGKGNGAWSSSNTTVATVTSEGAVTARAAGSADIIYTITGGCNGTVSDNATLNVNPNMSVAGVSVSLDSDDVCLGATPTASKSGSEVLSGGTAQFISSDPTVATVNATTGAISTLKAGTTDITYRVSGGCGSTVETLPAELTVKAKPTLTITPAGTIYNYMPMTVSSDMDVTTWAWSATANFVSGYFTSELTRSATFKGKVVDSAATRTATFTATGTNGCNGTIEQDITKDTESCTQ